MIGNRTKKTFHLGDPVCIQVVRTDKAERRIEFRFTEKEETSTENGAEEG